ncbi:MAG: DUF2436 domain-containing protein [Bacteroidales bacterium]|nr:DUF2436 domain-containing protein [Bacteroidales bacterium]
MKKLIAILVLAILAGSMNAQTQRAVSFSEKKETTVEKKFSNQTIQMKNLDSKQVQTKVNLQQRKSRNTDVATVTLRVIGDPFEGTGFQMVLDKNHVMADKIRNGEYYNENGLRDYFQIYDDCEFKIPENATPFNLSTTILDSEGSVSIPGGIYDWAIFFITTPDGSMSAASWMEFGESFIDDFMFLAGYEYVFFIEIVFFVEFDPEHDAKLTEIILPERSADLTNSEDVSVTIFNNGKHNFSGVVNLSYRINGGTIVTETYTNALTPGNEDTYTFNTKADFSQGGIYKVEVWIDYALDMIPFNNKVVGYTQKEAPIALPFIENFEHEYHLNQWTIIDANEDWATWHHIENAISVWCPHWQENQSSDDYLITTYPIIMPDAGTYNISFFVTTNDFVESLRILYGTSPNFEEMDVLANYPVLRPNAEKRLIIENFEIETPGNYYFAFHYYSQVDESGFCGSINIHNIAIKAGEAVLSPDITITNTFVPLIFCGTQTEVVISAEIDNIGTRPIQEFTLTYQINEGAVVTQTFTETINPYEETLRVYFDQTAGFLTEGAYRVRLTASTPGVENTTTNEIEFTSKVFEPVTTLPFESDFFNASDRADWTPEMVGGWEEAEVDGIYVARSGTPLLSRCVSLDAGVYLFSYNYRAGRFDAGGDARPINFYVAYGKAGTDPSSWEPAKEYHSHFTWGWSVDDGILLIITDPGDYVFGFFPVEMPSLFLIRTTSLTEALEHDLRISNIVSSLPRMIPKNHISGEKTFTMTVKNMGKTANESGTIKVLHNNTELISKNFVFTELGEIKDVELKPVLPASATTGLMKLAFEVSTESGVSKTAETSRIITDSTFAIDAIDYEFYNGVGLWSPGGLGMIYEFDKTDTLTSITVAFYALPNFEYDPTEFELAVYKVSGDGDNLEVGEMLFEVSYWLINRGNNMRGITFGVPRTEVVPGKYFIEVRQLGYDGLYVVYDEVQGGSFYLNVPWAGFHKETWAGNLHVRPNFGKYSQGTSIIEYISPTQAQLILSPNPATEVLNVKLEGTNIERVMVYDALGKVVHVSPRINQSTYQLNTERLNPGLYLISIQSKTGIVNSRFVIK